MHSFELVLDIEASNPSITSCCLIHPSQHRQQSGLSSSVWSKEPKHFSFLDPKSKVLDSYFELPSSDGWVLLAHVLDDERVLEVVSLVKVVYYVPFSFGICILQLRFVVIDWLVLLLSFLLELSDFIKVVFKLLDSFALAQKVPGFGNTVALWDYLVAVPS